jgi:hypothetical protein
VGTRGPCCRERGGRAGGSASNDEAQAAKPTAQAKPAQKTVLDDQLKALQKAKDVQKTVDDAAKARDKAIEDGGG